jgi:hypothetical protein
MYLKAEVAFAFCFKNPPYGKVVFPAKEQSNIRLLSWPPRINKNEQLYKQNKTQLSSPSVFFVLLGRISEFWGRFWNIINLYLR